MVEETELLQDFESVRRRLPPQGVEPDRTSARYALDPFNVLRITSAFFFRRNGLLAYAAVSRCLMAALHDFSG